MRNAPLYGVPGHAYVYLNYGIHCLVNVVTEPQGSPAAVLIRALDPLDGIDLMRRRRARAMKGRKRRSAAAIPTHDLCRGPGNLTMAMGITLAENRLGSARRAAVHRGRRIPTGDIAWGTRIGIKVGTGAPWRTWIAGHPAVCGASAWRSPLKRLQNPVMVCRPGPCGRPACDSDLPTAVVGSCCRTRASARGQPGGEAGVASRAARGSCVIRSIVWVSVRAAPGQRVCGEE